MNKEQAIQLFSDLCKRDDLIAQRNENIDDQYQLNTWQIRTSSELVRIQTGCRILYYEKQTPEKISEPLPFEITQEEYDELVKQYHTFQWSEVLTAEWAVAEFQAALNEETKSYRHQHIADSYMDGRYKVQWNGNNYFLTNYTYDKKYFIKIYRNKVYWNTLDDKSSCTEITKEQFDMLEQEYKYTRKNTDLLKRKKPNE